MTYVDTTLVQDTANGYSFVNHKQIYDVVAGAMTTKGWTFVEFVDAVSGAVTYRRYVWKCPAALSGLPADFFVVFQVPFTTASGAVTGWGSILPVRVLMGETYSGGVLGKFASNNTSVTLASDLTNPATATLSTYALPASIHDTLNTTNNMFGTMTTVTSLRFWCLATKDGLIISRAGSGGTAVDPTRLLYVGAYESAMSAAVDPMPIVLLGTNTAGTPSPGGGATRAPTMTPATAYADVLAVSNGYAQGNIQIGYYTTWVSNVTALGASGAYLGYPAASYWYKNLGGPTVSRLWLATSTTTANMPTLGIFRGYLKNVYGAYANAHSYGDTFLVDGKVMVGIGSTIGTSIGIVDTEAV